MKIKRLVSVVTVIFFLFILSTPIRASRAGQATDWTKVLGAWDLVIDGGDGYFYLAMTVERLEDKIGGKITDKSGMIPESALENLEFDGETLKFSITAASPPDGLSKIWTAEFKVGTGNLEGWISSQDLGISAWVTGSRPEK